MRISGSTHKNKKYFLYLNNLLTNTNDYDIINEYKTSRCEVLFFKGEEVFIQFRELLNFIRDFRENNVDFIYIETNYTKKEILKFEWFLRTFDNIFIKYKDKREFRLLCRMDWD